MIWRCHIGLDAPNDARPRGLGVPAPVRRAGRRVRVLARGVRLGGPRPRAARASSRRRSTPSPRRTRSSTPATVRRDPARAPGSSRRRGGRAPAFERQDGTPGARRAPRDDRSRTRPLRPGDALRAAGLALGRAQGPARRDRRLRRARRAAHRRAPGLRRARTSRRSPTTPRARRCSRRPRRAASALPPDVARARAPRLLPMDDLEENAAIVNALQRARRRRRAEEPRRGLRAHGRRGDVEGAARRRQPDRRHPGPDRATAVRACCSTTRATSPPTAPRCCGLLDDPDRARAIGERARERVRDRFLGSQSLLDYLRVVRQVLEGDPQAAPN